MIPAVELCPDDFQDIKKALVMQDAVDILPVLDQLFRFKLTSVFVLLLQLLQPQSYATNAGSIRTFGG